MFAMYDDDGLNFRSTLDSLYDIKKVSSVEHIHNSLKNNNQPPKQKFYDGEITQEAISQYKQNTNIDSGTEIFHVEQIMTRKVITVTDDYTVRECYDIMQENSIQQLPIVFDASFKLKGIITRYDIVQYIFNNIEDASIYQHHLLTDVATKKVITTDPISDIRRVAKVMIDLNLNALPVVNTQDMLVGIVSKNNIIKAVSSIPHLQLWA